MQEKMYAIVIVSSFIQHFVLTKTVDKDWKFVCVQPGDI